VTDLNTAKMNSLTQDVQQLRVRLDGISTEMDAFGSLICKIEGRLAALEDAENYRQQDEDVERMLEPKMVTDADLIAAVKNALNSYCRLTELSYFVNPESDEYEPLLLALRSAARIGSNIETHEVADEELLLLAQQHGIAHIRPDGDVLYPWQGSENMRADILSFARAVLARCGS
jgi:hypothetical protein